MILKDNYRKQKRKRKALKVNIIASLILIIFISLVVAIGNLVFNKSDFEADKDNKTKIADNKNNKENKDLNEEGKKDPEENLSFQKRIGKN